MQSEPKAYDLVMNLDVLAVCNLQILWTFERFYGTPLLLSWSSEDGSFKTSGSLSSPVKQVYTQMSWPRLSFCLEFLYPYVASLIPLPPLLSKMYYILH